MKYALKVISLFTLFVPFAILTIVIWIFGGWVKGWGYMPNPLDSLVSWATDF